MDVAGHALHQCEPSGLGGNPSCVNPKGIAIGSSKRIGSPAGSQPKLSSGRRSTKLARRLRSPGVSGTKSGSVNSHQMLQLAWVRYQMIRLTAILFCLAALVAAVFRREASDQHTHDEPGPSFPEAGSLDHVLAGTATAYRHVWVPYRGGAILPENVKHPE